jgi:hypothetical protein
MKSPNGKWVGLVVLLASSGTAARVAAREIVAESRVAGASAGTYREAAVTTASGETLTTIENVLIFNRLGSRVEMRSDSRYRESADGRLLAIHTEMSSSAQATTVDVEVKPGALAVRTSTGGKTYERSVELAGEVLGPAAARRLTLARLHATGDTVSYRVFVAELGSVTTISAVLTGVTAEALEMEQSMDAMPGKTAVWVDREGWLLRQVTQTPFGEVETVRSTWGAKAKEPAALPAESFERTMVKSNVRLPEEREIERLTIRITHKKPELGWPDFTADNQKVLEQTRDHVVLEIRRAEPDDMAPYLKPNALIQSDDAAVREIAKSVAGEERDAFRTALRLRNWTSEHMHFDAGIAVAPASEVARDRRGTCFGYAMLLGALARAAGIPSRVRMGLAYLDGAWGGHAWVDVFAGGRWLPLDAALESSGTADAARFSFFTSALEEGALAGVGALAQLYGNVEVQILEYRLHGKTVLVDGDLRRAPIQ